jgi:ArsR family transcriptional regulator, lead/cadmium/zinc/bismuth-responsive transcriptional repressor
MPSGEDVADLADVFHLLGDPNRVRILIALAGGRMAVRDVAAVVELSESAVSHALRLLRAHRVVSVEREGRVAYYVLADQHVRELLRLALEHVGHTVLLHPADEPSADDCARPHGGEASS